MVDDTLVDNLVDQHCYASDEACIAECSHTHSGQLNSIGGLMKQQLECP